MLGGWGLPDPPKLTEVGPLFGGLGRTTLLLTELKVVSNVVPAVLVALPTPGTKTWEGLFL